MKTLIAIMALLMLTLPIAAQKRISYSYTEIKITQSNSCNKTQYLVTNTQIKKQSGRLTIPTSFKTTKVFKDENSDENFHKFEYLGDIQGTNTSLIRRTDYNNEYFYLINRKNSCIDTLIGQPVFAKNMKDFACINNPGTDKKQQVQVCEIKNGAVSTRVYLKGKADTFLEDIICTNRNYILTKDNKGKYWKLSFKIGDE